MKKSSFISRDSIVQILFSVLVCSHLSFSQQPPFPPALAQTFQKLHGLQKSRNDWTNTLDFDNYDSKILAENVIPSFVRNAFESTEDLELFARTSLFDGVGAQCRNHTLEILIQLVVSPLRKKAPATWALQMFDAWGKFPSGILSGHTAIPGDFHECLQIRGNYTNPSSMQTDNFKGKYCTTYLIPTEKLKDLLSSQDSKAQGDGHWNPRESVTPIELVGTMIAASSIGMNMFPCIGTCFPSTCSTDDVKQIFSNFHKKVTFDYLQQYIPDCQTDEKPPFDTGDIVMICLLSLILCLCLIGSLFDLLVHRRKAESKSGTFGKVMLAFSVPLNTEKLFNTNLGSDNWGCLHGLRFLSMAWVLLGHTWRMGFFTFYWNTIDIWQINRDWSLMIVLNGNFCVDTFFVISGALMGHNLLKELQKNKGRFNYPLMVIHRYLRLTPTYMILVGMSATIVPYLASGPQWYIMDHGSELCAKNWWKNILYINNFFDAGEMCYGESWYLANDMQFFLVAPFIIYLLWRWKKIGLGILGALCIASIVSSAVIQHEKEVPPAVVPFIHQGTYFQDIYEKPWTRMGSYLVGLFLGYILYLKSKSPNTFRKIPKWVLFVGWIVSTGTALAVIFGIFDFFDMANEHEALTSVRSAVYSGLHCFVWGVMIAWIIFVCVSGYGGWVNKFLSWKVFVPLGRLTYCVYISSYEIQQLLHLTQTHPAHYSTYGSVNIYFSHLIMTSIFGYILTVTLESPFIQLEKLLLPAKRSTPPKEKSELPATSNEDNNNK